MYIPMCAKMVIETSLILVKFWNCLYVKRFKLAFADMVFVSVKIYVLIWVCILIETLGLPPFHSLVTWSVVHIKQRTSKGGFFATAFDLNE